MRFNLSTHATTPYRRRHFANTAIVFTLLLLGGLSRGRAQQCSFSSTSDGSDGNYDLTGTAAGSTVYFDAANFHGSGVANNVFNRDGSGKPNRGISGGSGLLWPRMAGERRSDEQTSPAESHSGVQGEGGFGRIER
jgi:hypothetical protein